MIMHNIFITDFTYRQFFIMIFHPLFKSACIVLSIELFLDIQDIMGIFLSDNSEQVLLHIECLFAVFNDYTSSLF